MDPIFIILYAVSVTLLITLLLPRLGDVGPRTKRILRISAAAGVVVLIVLVVLVLTR